MITSKQLELLATMYVEDMLPKKDRELIEVFLKTNPEFEALIHELELKQDNSFDEQLADQDQKYIETEVADQEQLFIELSAETFPRVEETIGDGESDQSVLAWLKKQFYDEKKGFNWQRVLVPSLILVLLAAVIIFWPQSPTPLSKIGSKDSLNRGKSSGLDEPNDSSTVTTPATNTTSGLSQTEPNSDSNPFVSQGQDSASVRQPLSPKSEPRFSITYIEETPNHSTGFTPSDSTTKQYNVTLILARSAESTPNKQPYWVGRYEWLMGGDTLRFELTEAGANVFKKNVSIKLIRKKNDGTILYLNETPTFNLSRDKSIETIPEK